MIKASPRGRLICWAAKRRKKEGILFSVKEMLFKNDWTIKGLEDYFPIAYSTDPVLFEKLPGVNHKWAPAIMVELYRITRIPNLSKKEMVKRLNAVPQGIELSESTIYKKISSTDWDKFKKTLMSFIQEC